MPRNIEIKAQIRNMRRLKSRLAATGACGPETLVQTDTFFQCSRGRMKLRECRGRAAELIVYIRPDSKEPKQSDYFVLPVSDAKHVRRLLGVSHGVVGVVHKTRQVYLLDSVRIHVDEVADLGNFIELEVLLHDRNKGAGVRIANNMMRQLGIMKGDLVRSAYIDMPPDGRQPAIGR